MTTDEPIGEAMELVVPFVVCQSKGGPYEDDAFVAGFQAGDIYRALAAALAANASEVTFHNVRTALVPQLELLAMNRDFPLLEVDTSDGWPDWSAVTFRRERRPRDDG